MVEMKINPIKNPGVLQSYKANWTAPLPKNKSGQSQDEVTLSSEGLSFAKTLSDIREQIETRTPAENAHIDDIARQVKEGTYNVRAEDVADKMIRSIIFDK